MNRIAREVAEASRALETELPVKQSRSSYPNVLVDIAKKLQRQQSKVRSLGRALRLAQAEVKLTKKEMRAVIGQMGRGEA